MIRIFLRLFLVLGSTQCLAQKADYELMPKKVLLQMTTVNVLIPQARSQQADFQSAIGEAMASRVASCELRHLEGTTTDSEARVLYFTWGAGQKREKEEVVAKFGNDDYTSAIAKYVDAVSDCLEETILLKKKLLEIAQASP
ncbi:hypothetical protein B0E46_16405 [Rhodanobacter sp. B04]|nr:hypothetical protein B0E46_16405 [Rhodanobacter sp. B04]